MRTEGADEKGKEKRKATREEEEYSSGWVWWLRARRLIRRGVIQESGRNCADGGCKENM